MNGIPDPANNLSATYTYADYLTWPSEERVELINGVKFPMHAHSGVYDGLIAHLHELIYDFLRSYSGKASVQPFDLRIPTSTGTDEEIRTVLQPEVCVICNPDILDERGCVGAPDIVMTILTAQNASIALREKYEVYENAGVKEYWLISPHDRIFQVYILKDGKFEAQRSLAGGDKVTCAILPGFTIDVAEFFEATEESAD